MISVAPITDAYDHLTPSDWEDFARAWLAQLREQSHAKDDYDDVGLAVVLMNFTARPHQQWCFIRAAVAYAESDDELSHVAAGPIEQLLSAHGDEYIAMVEAEAATNPKFRRMMKTVWRHRMSEEVWTRVQALQR